jgi:hypothetical protein
VRPVVFAHTVLDPEDLAVPGAVSQSWRKAARCGAFLADRRIGTRCGAEDRTGDRAAPQAHARVAARPRRAWRAGRSIPSASFAYTGDEVFLPEILGLMTLTPTARRLRKELMRLDKPIGVAALLRGLLCGDVVFGFRLPILAYSIFVWGPCSWRSAGCVVNDYADRNFDGTSSARAIVAWREASSSRGGARWPRVFVIAFVLVLFTILAPSAVVRSDRAHTVIYPF